jgi:hypothetical protein
MERLTPIIRKHTFVSAGEHKIFTAGKPPATNYKGWKNKTACLLRILRFLHGQAEIADVYDVLFYVANWL